MSVTITHLSVRLNSGRLVQICSLTNTLLTPNLSVDEIKEAAEKVKAFELEHNLKPKCVYCADLYPDECRYCK